MPTRKRIATSLAIEVGGLRQKVHEMHEDIAAHIKEEHEWLTKLNAVTVRLEALDSIKVNGNVGLESGLRDIYKKTDKISVQIEELVASLAGQLRRHKVADDLTKWLQNSSVSGFLFTKFSRTLLLVALGAALWEHEKVFGFVAWILK